MTVPALPERYNVGTILDTNLEAGRGDKVAIRGEGGEVTYGQLLASACAAGRALRALGVQREQRVMLVLDDTPAFPAAFLGAIRAGIVPVPVNPLFKPDDYRYLIGDSDARVVVVDLKGGGTALLAIEPNNDFELADILKSADSAAGTIRWR